jgi:hypothetical protein
LRVAGRKKHEKKMAELQFPFIARAIHIVLKLLKSQGINTIAAVEAGLLRLLLIVEDRCFKKKVSK